jgi:hypothetical protein
MKGDVADQVTPSLLTATALISSFFLLGLAMAGSKGSAFGRTEVHLALNKGHLAASVTVERMAVEDRQVRILANLNATDPRLRPSCFAGLIVTVASASTSLSPPYFTSFAASAYRCRINSLLSDFRQTDAPASCSRALNGTAS